MCASHTEQTHTRWLLGHRQSPSLVLLSCLLSLCGPLLSPCLEKKLTELQPRQGSHDTEQVLGLGTQTLRFPSDFQNSVWGFSEEMVALKRQTEFLARKAFSRHWMTEWGSRVLEGSASNCRQACSWAGAQDSPVNCDKVLRLGIRLSHFLSDFCPHRGHSPEWYNKGFGHLCAAEVARIRNSFQPLIAEGPETKIWVFPSVTSTSGKRKWTETLLGESVLVRKQERERETEWLG